MKRRGSAIVEAAAVLAVFALLSAGVLRAVGALIAGHLLDSAVHAGALAAAAHPRPDPDDPGFRAAIIAKVTGHAPAVAAGDVRIEISRLAGEISRVRVGVVGSPVTASYPWTGPARPPSGFPPRQTPSEPATPPR
jgi:Flp pilus assembly protein TadG